MLDTVSMHWTRLYFEEPVLNEISVAAQLLTIQLIFCMDTEQGLFLISGSSPWYVNRSGLCLFLEAT